MNKPIIFFTIFLAIIQAHNAYGQDSLSVAQLKPITYSFDIENGKMIGDGKTFLSEELSKAQFTMIGEYHGSKRISEFTEAIIPILDSVGYKTMVTEVGPITGQILNDLNSNIQIRIESIIEKYKFVEEDGYVNTPFPFFENIEDANFLEEAKNRNWRIIGIDQEYYYSHQMLIDKMYNNLSSEKQLLNKELYEHVTDSITKYYIMDINGEMDLALSIKNSSILKDFTTTTSTTLQNDEIAEALYASNHIYFLYSNNQWFENNSTRIKYMKSQLRKQLQRNEFNLNKDKLLIKMGQYHLSKGFSPLGLYEVGNTLNEIAEYHGNTALNIAFSSRFYMEDGEVVDILESDNQYEQRLNDLNQMGEKDEWVVIDLRPMIKGHFYRPVKYKFNEHVEDLVKRYDLLVIPKIETEPTPNYIVE